MSNRRHGKARRKLFSCGHKSFGRWCHQCEQAQQGRVPPVAVRHGSSPRALARRKAPPRSAFAFGAVASALVLLLALHLSSCVTRNGQTHVDWPRVASCAPSTGDVITSVSRVLLGDGDSTQRSISERAVSELEDLARTHTPTLIACLVNEVVSGWSRPGAAVEPNRVAATQRGRDFLDRVAGTSVVQREGEP